MCHYLIQNHHVDVQNPLIYWVTYHLTYAVDHPGIIPRENPSKNNTQMCIVPHTIVTVPSLQIIASLRIPTYSVQLRKKSLYLSTWVLFTELATWYEKYTKKETTKRPKVIPIPTKKKQPQPRITRSRFLRSLPSRGTHFKEKYSLKVLTDPSVPPLWRDT